MGKPAILCDFDGTVTVEEVSTTLLDQFTGREWRKADQDLLAGRISLRETMAHEFSLLCAPRAEMEDFVKRIHIRKGFAGLVRAARTHHAPLYIVSEGLDFYIAAFLKAKRIDAAFRANHAVFARRGIIVEHPFSDDRCGRCGTCKLAQIRNLKRKGYVTVFIGDGISDWCPAGHADLLFARGGLLRYCRKERIGCIPYRSFNDILCELRKRFWRRDTGRA